MVGWSMEYRGADPKGAKVQIGAVLLCKGGKGEAEEDYRVQSTEYGKAVVQRCKSEQSSCAKVEK